MVRVTQPILDLTAERPRDTFTPLQLSKIIGCSINSCRVALKRLANSHRIARVSWGLYQHPSGLIYPGGIDPRLRIHALHCQADVPKRGVRGSPKFGKMVYTRFHSFETRPHPNNGNIIFRGEWQTRLLTITLHPPKRSKVEIFLECSLLPLHPLELHAFLGGFLPGAFDLPLELWTVLRADWNIDIPGSVKADLDFTGLSVAAFQRFILKVYQKAEELVRTEVRDFEPLSSKRLLAYFEAVLLTLKEVHDG